MMNKEEWDALEMLEFCLDQMDQDAFLHEGIYDYIENTVDEYPEHAELFTPILELFSARLGIYGKPSIGEIKKYRAEHDGEYPLEPEWDVPQNPPF